MDPDFDDLQQFVRTRDNAAFGRVVARHADLVHGTCMRLTRDPGMADDAAQAVFIVLARKAGAIRRGTSLAGWLYNVARYASRNVLRAEQRRRKYERAASAPVETPTAAPDSAHEIRDLLDAAMARLGRRDQEAILMRYFQGKTHEEIAAASGGGAHAAKMRVLRALDRLRAALAREGMTTMPAAIEAGLLAAASHRAPGGFVDAATKSATGTVVGTGAGIAAAIVTGMIMRKVAVVAIVVGSVLTIAGVTLAVAKPANAPAVKTQATTTTTPASDDANWRKDFDSVYRLDAGEAIRRVQAPYIPARQAYYLDWFRDHGPITGFGNGVVGSGRAAYQEKAPVAMFFRFDSDTNRVERIIRFNEDPWRTGTLLFALVGINPHEYLTPPSFIERVLPGDWVMRSDATVEQKLASFQQAIADSLAAFTYRKQTIPREVIVIRGTFERDKWPNGTMRLTIAEEGQTPGKSAGGDVGYFVREWSRILRRPIVIERWDHIEDARIEFDLTAQKLATLSKEAEVARVRELVKRMGEQMRVEMELVTKGIETWVIEPLAPGKK